jgi:hypothetical protein
MLHVEQALTIQHLTIESTLWLKTQPNQILGALLLGKTRAKFSTLENAAC